MPVVCSCCGEVLVLGSLRCSRCGADARQAPALPGLSFADVIGHDVEAFMVRALGPAGVRRARILDRLQELSPAFLAWARENPAQRGPCPELVPEIASEIDALCAEYEQLARH